jgi:hypothetical protein
MRKLFFLFTFCAGILTAQSQTFTSGLTTTGTGASANTRLGGTSALLANTNLELGTFNFNLNNGKVGIGVAAPLSLLHIKAGTATVAPLIFTTGVNLTTAVAGAMEYNGTSLLFTPTTALGRKTIAYADFTNLSGILSVANGGTGASTNTGVLIGNGTAATSSTPATAGLQYLRRNAGNTAYEFATITGGTGTVTSVGLTVPVGLSVAPAAITTSGTFAITTTLNGLLRGNGTGFATGQANLATEVTGVLTIANGGTGATTNTGVLIGNGTAATTSVGTATASLYLRRNATNNGYEFGALPAGTGGTLGGEVTGAQTATVVGNAAVIGKVLTGYASTTGTVTATDNILQAIGKLNGNDALKVVANAGIIAATNTKITYDSKGLVIAGTSLASADIPNNAANTTGNAATSTTATNIVGGAAGAIPYQTGVGATGMSAVGTSGYVLTSGGAGIPIWKAATTLPINAWKLGGNAGTNPANDFIGTTDGAGLKFKVNNMLSGFMDGNLSNTSFGIGSLLNNTTGEGNTAFGDASMLNNTLGEGNTAFGQGSLNNNINGSFNTTLGRSSMASNTSGESNTAIGYGALNSNLIGNNNTAIGAGADVSVGISNSTVVGWGAYATSSNSLILGSIAGVNNGVSTSVGIGTSAPTEKLDVVGGNIRTNEKIIVNGGVTSKVLIGNMFDANNIALNIGDHKLVVNGSALFTKAVVRLTSTWPDFVFEPTYNLPTLSQVEAYITKNKHLEGVPSAAEVKEKGIDLGDNQTILLKKVEELTLYMIELNKKVEVLAKENEELKKKVNGDK